MKIRQGFVSNSSSASFTIDLEKLTQKQIDAIIDHSEYAAEMGLEYAQDEWAIEINKCRAGFGTITGFTWMDNFDMHEYFRRVGIPEEIVEWDEDNS